MRYTMAALLLAAGFLVRLLLTPVLGDRVPYILAFPTTALIAWYCGWVAGLISIPIQAGLAHVYFTHPFGTVDPTEPLNLYMALTFALSSAFIVGIVESLRKSHAVNERLKIEAVQKAEELQKEMGERKRAQEESLQLAEQLQRRARELEDAYRSLESFSYSVSHDLRTPLRGVDLYCEMLGETYANKPLDAEGLDLLKKASQNARHAYTLIGELLKISNLERATIQRAPLDMTRIAREAWNEIARSEGTRKPELNLHPLPPASGDAAMVRQIFTHLISNAVKFTRPRDSGMIEIGSKRSEAATIYYVRDNGVGFEMQHAKKLFHFFQRLHGDGLFEGTGVGLATVERIVRRHGGKIWAEGFKDKGATFYFMLEPPRG